MCACVCHVTWTYTHTQVVFIFYVVVYNLYINFSFSEFLTAACESCESEREGERGGWERERVMKEKKMGLAFVVVKCVVALSLFDVIFCIFSWNFCTFVKVWWGFIDWWMSKDNFRCFRVEFQNFWKFCTQNYIKCGIYRDFTWIISWNVLKCHLKCTNVLFSQLFTIHSSTLRSFLFLFWNFFIHRFSLRTFAYFYCNFFAIFIL